MGDTGVFAAINAGSNTTPAKHERSGRKRSGLWWSAPTAGQVFPKGGHDAIAVRRAEQSGIRSNVSVRRRHNKKQGHANCAASR